jgi:TolB-like protein/Tfp pilus assembly protein PilF
LAVLPLASLSSDPEQEYFAEGMTDVLITTLASSMRTLRVTSRQSVLRYRQNAKPVPEIARELGVDAVIEGTIVHERGRVRITAQLIHAGSDRHLWAGRYERDLRDVLALQDELARAIAREVQVALTAPAGGGASGSRRTVNAEAYESYLRGRYLWNRLGEENLRKALEAFRRSAQIDPGFAQAYVGIADCYSRLGWYGLLPPREAAAQMKEAVLKALALDDSLGEAHSALGDIASDHWDWPLAEKELRRALELNPSDAVAHLRLGLVFEILGRHQESVSERRRALELDPLDRLANAALGTALLYSGDDDAALRQMQKALELDPDFRGTHLVLGAIWQAKGECQQAIDAYKKAEERGALGHALATCGRPREARALLKELEQRAKTGYVSPLDIAVVHAGLGQRDQALAWLEKAYEQRVSALPHVGIEQQFANLRSDARFQDLLRRTNLPTALRTPLPSSGS